MSPGQVSVQFCRKPRHQCRTKFFDKLGQVFLAAEKLAKKLKVFFQREVELFLVFRSSWWMTGLVSPYNCCNIKY